MIRPVPSFGIATALAVASAGCDRTATTEPPPHTTATARSPEGWRIDGEGFQPATVLALGSEGESSWRLTVARTSLGCDDVRRRFPEHAPGPDAIDLWVAHPLAPDGTREGWSYRSAVWTTAQGSRSLVARGAMLEELTEHDDAVIVRGLEIALEERGTNRRLVQFEGDLRATNCGRVRRPEAVRPQPKLVFSVSGQAIPVLGATVRIDAGRRILRLTRAPHRCDSVFTEGFDFYADLAFEGTPPRLVHVALLGDAFPETATGSKGRESFVLRSSNLDAPGGDARLDLHGTIDAGGYAVTVEGTVQAQRCVTAAR